MAKTLHSVVHVRRVEFRVDVSHAEAIEVSGFPVHEAAEA